MTVTVWHANAPNFTDVGDTDLDLACYTKRASRTIAPVDDVEQALGQAYIASQNITDTGWLQNGAWDHVWPYDKNINEDVCYFTPASFGPRARSTSVGDLIEVDGTFYAVQTIGFAERCTTDQRDEINMRDCAGECSPDHPCHKNDKGPDIEIRLWRKK